MSRLPNLAQEANLPPPENIEDLEDLHSKVKILVTALNKEIYETRFKINQLINGEFGILHLDARTTEPLTAEKRAGTIAYADGTVWNPGSGAGVYRWDGSAWKYLG